MSTFRLLVGDCRETLRTLPDASVQCVVTSPPYWGLRDYGHAGQLGLESTPEEYVARMVAVFREVRRTMRDDGTLWLNLGDSYASSPPGNSTNGVSGNSTLNGVNGASGRYRETLDAGHATKRNTIVGDLKPKDLVGIPWRVAFALQADGWWLRSDIIWAKPNPMPESVTDRPTKAHEYVFLMSKSATYHYDADAIAERVSDSQVGRVRADPVGGAAHVERGQHSEGGVYTGPKKRPSAPRGSFNGKTEAMASEGRNAFRAVTETRNARSVWTIATRPYPEAHFATFPPELAERCIRAGSKPGDTVLDPFAGSGTTGAVALGHGRRFIGCELNPAYVEMARHRIGPMFEEAAA